MHCLFLILAVGCLCTTVSVRPDNELQLERVHGALFILDRHNTSLTGYRKSLISGHSRDISSSSSSSSSNSAARSRRSVSVYDSVECGARSLCKVKVMTSEADSSSSSKPSPGTQSPHPRNCYCDALCVEYNDCCADHVHFRNYPTRKQQTIDDVFDVVPVAALPPEVVSCETLPELHPADGSEIYIVRACPKSFVDASVTSFCGNSYDAIEESFFNLPVTGLVSRVLYANFFCALCNGETNVTFWQATVRCNRFHLASAPTAAAHDGTGNVILRHVLRHFATHDCEMDYRHPDLGHVTRTCQSNIGRCDKSWPDDEVRRQCRGHTAYAYAGVRAFRNKFCAICNYVNASYLSCEDKRPALVPVQPAGSAAGDHAFTAMIDVNVGRAVLRIAKQQPPELHHRHQHLDNGTEAGIKVDFLKCLVGHIYDPFADVCRRLKCIDGYVFRDNLCVLPASRLPSNQQHERELGLSVATTASLPVSLPFLTSFITPFTKLSPSSPSVDNVQPASVDKSCVTSFQQDGVSGQHAVEVCLEVSAGVNTSVNHLLHQSQSTSDKQLDYVTMFQFSELQKILSLAAGIVSSTILLFHLLIYSASVSLKQSVRARCHVSMCSALALAQCTYVVRDALHDILPPSVCTLVAVAMHYSHLTAFFWVTCATLTLYQAFSAKQRHGNEKETFKSLALVCWLLPALIAGVTLAVHVLASPYFTAPVYLYKHCWLCNIHAFVSAFLLPAGITVLADFVICVCIVKRTRQQRDKLHHHHHHNGYSYDAVELPCKDDKGQGQGYSRSLRGGDRSLSTSSLTNGSNGKRVCMSGGSLATPLVVTCQSSTLHRRSLTAYVALLILMTSSWLTAILTVVWPQFDSNHSSVWFVFIGCQATIGPLICITFSFTVCSSRRRKDSHRSNRAESHLSSSSRKCSTGSVGGTPGSRQNGAGCYSSEKQERNGGRGTSVRWTDELPSSSSCLPPSSATLSRKQLKVVARETSI